MLVVEAEPAVSSVVLRNS